MEPVAGAVQAHIVVIEALFGTAEAFFKPALTGLVPQTVPEEEIQPARAATSTIETVAEFVGPALATALVLGLGAGWAFALDSLTFLVSAAFLLRVRTRDRGERVERRSVAVELREGWAAFRSRAWVWSIVLAFSLALLFSFAPFTTLGPTVADQEYSGPGVFGVLAATLGAGTILGALIGFRWRPLHPMRIGTLLALAVAGVDAGVRARAAARRSSSSRSSRAGVGIALFEIWWHTALAERVPPHLLVAGERLRLDGLARAAAARLPDLRAARRGARRPRGAHRRRRGLDRRPRRRRCSCARRGRCDGSSAPPPSAPAGAQLHPTDKRGQTPRFIPATKGV